MTREPRKRSVLEAAEDLLPPEPDIAPSAQRPGALVGGTVLLVLRALGGPLWMLGFLRQWPSLRTEFDLDAESEPVVLGIILGAVALWTLVLLVFGFGLWRGSNTARMLVQAWTALSITSAAIAYFAGDDGLTVRATLLTLALDILILLALSSRAARAWTRGKSRRWARLERDPSAAG
ncbi:hypothetical protein [Leucobacter chromiireducens]|uniref:Uncharacterized protein n=1 Tax=Leucobacter chromiireducens subsp. solipictus TaxID=398235 RepID=A0ABS1SIP4_9MICO|nr:hypothetical protein [Leucobacter chromiireducens]MBL3680439.1 hypothetical protein [Leucobacter chromiireducens subsp. solipictus]